MTTNLDFLCRSTLGAAWVTDSWAVASMTRPPKASFQAVYMCCEISATRRSGMPSVSPAAMTSTCHRCCTTGLGVRMEPLASEARTGTSARRTEKTGMTCDG
jgi:hypothetical protein